MSLRARIVAAIRRRLPELDEEAAWRGALAGAASLFLLLVAIAVLVPLRDDLDTGSIALVLLLPPLVASNGGRALSIVARADQRAGLQLPLHAALQLVPHRVVDEHRGVRRSTS